MVSTAAGEGTSYGGGGGAGGKFRKQPSRRHQATPYDRPPTALPNPKTNGWLPKLVDPATKLIFATARSFFSSVFRKRLIHLPPPLPQGATEANGESRDRLQDAVPNNSPGVEVTGIAGGGNTTNKWDSSGISRLEQILEQKSFTRSEVDRLTELLHSKTIDLPNGDEDKMSELNVPQPVSAYEMQHHVSSSPIWDHAIESHSESHRFHGSTPVISSQVHEEDVASPAELAKAYMGSSHSKVSPSMLGLGSQGLRENANLLDKVSFPSKTPVMSLVPKPAVRSGIPENGFMNQRSRGRSAIYFMGCTPYSKVTSSGNDGYGGPSASPSSLYPWEHDGQHGSNQLALKRRSSVLEDDIGSITPIRRLRQKTSLSTPKNLQSPVSGSSLYSRGTGVGSNAARRPTSSTQKPFFIDEPKQGSLHRMGENEDNSIPSTSYTPVPSKSSEMATRILQQLEKLVPKEKLSEGKVFTGREKSPSKLTPSMLRGQALRSLADVDSSKILQNALDVHKLEDASNTCLPDARDTTAQKQGKVQEHGPKKLVVSRETLTPAVTRDITVSGKDTVAGVNTADSVVTPPLTQPPKTKWAFQMSAHEDFLDLDDEIHSSEATCTAMSQEKEKLETSMVESKAAYTEAVMVNKISTLSEMKPPDGPVIKKSTDLGTSEVSLAGEKNNGFTFHSVPASSTTFEPVVVNLQSTSAFDRIVPHKESNSPPLFGLETKNPNKVPSLSFSSSSSPRESFGLKSDAPSESKPESSYSLANTASGATVVIPKIPKLDKGDNKDTPKSGVMMGKSEITSSAAVSTSVSASSIFSFGAPASSSGLSNGSLASSPSIFSSPAPVPISGDFTSQKFGNTFTNIASSTTVTVATNGTTPISASDSGVSSSFAAPSIPAAPIFKFGSTPAAPSNSASMVLTTSSAETTDMKAKSEKETTFGNLSNSPFGGTSFGMASTGSSIFGFGASATSSSTNKLSQGSLFGTTSGSLGLTQASPAETGVATVTQSMPIQFGSSASSPVFGTSGTTSFTSSSSLFGSSTSSSSLFGSSTSSSSQFGSSTSPKLFDSSTSFGLSSSVSSSQTNTISSIGAVNSGLFGSSWQPATFTSVSPSTVFAFGASSVSVSATNSTPTVFGSSNSASSGSIFSFSSASADANAASSQPQPVFGSAIPVFTTASGNGDQMSMEDSMSEDPVQAPTPGVPVFGQPPVSAPPSSFAFGSAVPSAGIGFQFGNQQNQSTPQMPPPFQSSSSLEFGAAGSFSLGSGGGDKSARKIVKVKHKNRKRP